MTIIESVRNYILKCPYLEDLQKVNVNFLPENTDNCSIEEVPNQNGSLTKKFLDGSS